MMTIIMMDVSDRTLGGIIGAIIFSAMIFFGSTGSRRDRLWDWVYIWGGLEGVAWFVGRNFWWKFFVGKRA